ncbi:iron complex transport system substrate-binding protein [Haloactinopolyspora alba]|uniref:Iron complex transport system substrate-binding protein n=1 Tax=Haloactinopolyspora alba TaxID=648780 RepID=A0A2P8EGD5_9ACTN|nr:ABC transporter substrate-binding protein [Haloactinopolyspora alba]PSL08527.1 iron complex transport system substrate-binding protein [Haloactinopolyspora alba]
MAVAARALPISRRVVVLCLSGGLLLAACGTDEPATTSDDEASPPSSSSAPDRAEPVAAERVTLDNCGVEVTIDAPPERVVTMNQAATEVLLTLGLQDRMVGTAYLDDEILPGLAHAYDAVPVLADGYPSSETVLDTDPELVYGAYPSAFTAENAGERAALSDVGVASYLSPSACPGRPDDEPLGIETVWREFREIGAIFGAGEAADRLVAEQRARLDDALTAAGEHGSTEVMWWDGGTDVPTVGGCCGAPAMIMRAAGATNVFADVDGAWADVSWEQVAERAPDVIVLVDADWSTAAEKRDLIESTPAVRDLPVVREGRFVVIPFSATTPGVRNVDAIVELIDGLEGS